MFFKLLSPKLLCMCSESSVALLINVEFYFFPSQFVNDKAGLFLEFGCKIRNTAALPPKSIKNYMVEK